MSFALAHRQLLVPLWLVPKDPAPSLPFSPTSKSLTNRHSHTLHLTPDKGVPTPNTNRSQEGRELYEGMQMPLEAPKPPSTLRGDRGIAALPAVQTPGASTCSGGQAGTHPAAALQPDVATQLQTAPAPAPAPRPSCLHNTTYLPSQLFTAERALDLDRHSKQSWL